MTHWQQYIPLFVAFVRWRTSFKRRNFRVITRVTNVSGENVHQSWKCPCQCCYQCVPHTSVVLCLFLFYWKCHTTSHWVFVYFDLAALFARHRVEGWRETEVVPGQDLAGRGGAGPAPPSHHSTCLFRPCRRGVAPGRAGRRWAVRAGGGRASWLVVLWVLPCRVLASAGRAECWRAGLQSVLTRRCCAAVPGSTQSHCCYSYSLNRGRAVTMWRNY